MSNDVGGATCRARRRCVVFAGFVSFVLASLSRSVAYDWEVYDPTGDVLLGEVSQTMTDMRGDLAVLQTVNTDGFAVLLAELAVQSGLTTDQLQALQSMTSELGSQTTMLTSLVASGQTSADSLSSTYVLLNVLLGVVADGAISAGVSAAHLGDIVTSSAACQVALGEILLGTDACRASLTVLEGNTGAIADEIRRNGSLLEGVSNALGEVSSQVEGVKGHTSNLITGGVLWAEIDATAFPGEGGHPWAQSVHDSRNGAKLTDIANRLSAGIGVAVTSSVAGGGGGVIEYNGPLPPYDVYVQNWPTSMAVEIMTDAWVDTNYIAGEVDVPEPPEPSDDGSNVEARALGAMASGTNAVTELSDAEFPDWGLSDLFVWPTIGERNAYGIEWTVKGQQMLGEMNSDTMFGVWKNILRGVGGAFVHCCGILGGIFIIRRGIA